MQIIIDLKKEEKEGKGLYELLNKLEKDNYNIHSLYGNFIYNIKEKKVMDEGESGYNISPSLELASSIYKTGGKLAIIFTKEKYIAFSNNYIIAISMASFYNEKPISIKDTLDNYNELVINNDNNKLQSLYKRK